MDLPKPLKPWAAVLDLFPRELAGALGPLVLRLDRQIGSPRIGETHQTGEPDGFDGLSLRGPYERLLLSDWLLLSELPEEFIRRAALGEHTFYRLQRRLPAGIRSSAVLFDSGPDSWGGPRVGHLAALIVLERRAVAAGMRFYWGSLQFPAIAFERITPDSIKAWLKTRSDRPPTSEDLAAWQERLREVAGLTELPQDFWLVGGSGLSAVTARQASHLILRDSYLPEQRQLAVSLRQTDRGVGTGRTESLLELPTDALCTRLLRDPFEAPRSQQIAGSGKYVPDSNLIFDIAGVKMFARSQEGQIIAYPIPNSPNAPYGNPRLYRSAYLAKTLAVGRNRRAVMLFNRTVGGALRLETFGGKSSPSRLFNVPIDLSVAEASDRLGYADMQQDGSILLHLGSGELLLLPASDRDQGRKVTGGIAVSRTGNEIIAAWDGDLRVLRKDRLENPEAVHGSVVFFGHATEAYFGSNAPFRAMANYVAVAIASPGNTWLIAALSPPYHEAFTAGELITVGDGARVVGLAPSNPAVSGGNGVVRPVCLERNRRTVTLRDASARIVLHQASTPILHASVTQAGPLYLAYITESGEVVVYDLWRRAIVYRLEATGARPRMPELEVPETNELTGLPGMLALRLKLEERLARADREQTQLFVILAEINGFDDYARKRGGIIADGLLKSIGAVCSAWAAKYGGVAGQVDEAAFLLSFANPPGEDAMGQAMARAYELYNPIRGLCAPEEGLSAASAAFGVVSRKPGMGNVNDMLRLARRAAERSRDEGGIRVEIAHASS